MVSGVKAIPTRYNGVLYASGLEADWAATLKRLGVVALAEPDGVRLPDGEMYLYDLWLPQSRVALEVKGPHNHRLYKSSMLAEAMMHAPGCATGHPERTFNRPAGVTPAACRCGFGPDFPFWLVVVGRPAAPARTKGLAASMNGYAQWESAPGFDQQIVLVECPIRHRPFLMDAAGIGVCRCCWQPLPAGTLARRAGEVPFHKVPRGIADHNRKARIA